MSSHITPVDASCQIPRSCVLAALLAGSTFYLGHLGDRADTNEASSPSFSRLLSKLEGRGCMVFALSSRWPSLRPGQESEE